MIFSHVWILLCAGLAVAQNRPSLIAYNPVANASAVVLSTDGYARFTVLTPSVIRMQYARAAGRFEDNATIAILNRALPVPAFSVRRASGVLSITTASVALSYLEGQPFSPDSLSVVSINASSAFTRWVYGDANDGNLLGTIRGLDQQNNTSLNCSVNSNTLDNGESNHCEWGMISRDGWVVYDDTANYVLDDMDWWIPSGVPPPPLVCAPAANNSQPIASSPSAQWPNGTTAPSAGDCCAICLAAPDCIAWMYATNGTKECWPLSVASGSKGNPHTMLGITTNVTGPASAQNGDALDLYGFFHGHDYFGALADFVLLSGRTIMVPKYASGVWWSRWLNLNNFDVQQVVASYASRSLPLDVYVMDMDWHTKDAWGGWTFDEHLFPFPADTINYLNAMGLPVTLNTHDASGVLTTDAMYDALVAYLGVTPAPGQDVALNLWNATVAYAVSDVVWGDLIRNKNISFAWIDWQQGGYAGGMSGEKQNPTIWLAHLRSTDRHRVGDTTRGMVLSRWGGLGGHRYQVGFSGDVFNETWTNLAYQSYFSVTAANVGHGFWSHDIEGPSGDGQQDEDMEIYTRWVQSGAYSGTMRSHGRGITSGVCANAATYGCSVVEVWDVPAVNFPVTYEEARAIALRTRGMLLPYVYTYHRLAFDTGVGLLRAMYFHYPELEAAYAMNGNGNGVQYMFGAAMLVAPVVMPGNASAPGMGVGMATRSVWLPPGNWFDTVSGVLTTVPAGDDNHQIVRAFSLAQIPVWVVTGSIIAYVPLRSLPTSIGNARRQYTFLGFKIVPPGDANTTGFTDVYEDDGETTAYLTAAAFAWTRASYTLSGDGYHMSITVNTTGAYPELPSSRAVQLMLLHSPPLASVVAGGVNVTYSRYGSVATLSRLPTNHQHYYTCAGAPYGMGAVIDVVNVSTASPVVIQVTFAVAWDATFMARMSGVYGSITNAIGAKANLDIERITPDSKVDGPAYTSVLASTGGALEYLAGTDAAAFMQRVADVPTLLANATAEVRTLASKKPRALYSLAMLEAAAM